MLIIYGFENNKSSVNIHICEIRTSWKDYFMPKVSSIKLTKKENIYDNVIKVSLPHLKQQTLYLYYLRH